MGRFQLLEVVVKQDLKSSNTTKKALLLGRLIFGKDGFIFCLLKMKIKNFQLAITTTGAVVLFAVGGIENHKPSFFFGVICLLVILDVIFKNEAHN